MTAPDDREHVLFVHAHPDDETIATGGTIATLRQAGSAVTLLTCTRGERGETVPAELRHLSGQALGAHREAELAEAAAILGIEDHRFLGEESSASAGASSAGPHRYLDSGMQWGPDGAEALSVPAPSAVPAAPAGKSAQQGQTLTQAQPEQIVADIVSVIDQVRPTAIVSYDARGGYGHPDHVCAHETARAAARLTRVPFYTIVPGGQEAPGDIHVDIGPVLGRKKQALRAHRSQLTVDGDTIIHSGGQVEPIRAVESYRRLAHARDTGLEWAQLGSAARIAACLAAAILGGLIGTIGTANHQIGWSMISLGIVALLLAGLRMLLATRIAAVFAILGLVGVLWGFSQTGPGGSVLIPAVPTGFLWAYGPLAISFLVLAWPGPGTFARATMGRESTPGKGGTP